MRTTIALIAALIATPASAVDRTEHGDVILDGVPPIPSALAAKLAPYLQLRQSSFMDWTPDGALLVKTDTAEGEQILRVDEPLADGNPPASDAPPSVERRAAGEPRQAPDGKGLYYLSDQGSEFKQLRYLELQPESGKPPVDSRLSVDVPGDVDAFDLSADGHYLAYTTNEGGISRLRLRDVRNGFDLPSPPVPNGVISNLSFDPGGTRLALTLETARTPREVYVYTVGAAALTQWTLSNPATLDTAQFADAQLVRYPTFDISRMARGTRQIPTFVFKPRSEDKNGSEPSPVLIDLRSGPEMQARPGFDPFTQFLVKELGVTVIAPNMRGAEGYGRSYAQLDNRFNREDVVKDIGALLAWIGQQPDLDRQRIIVMGEGYGGYLSLAALMHFGDRLLGGIDVSGINDFIGYMRNTVDYRRDARREEFGDERELGTESYLRRLSPLHHSQRIAQPLFIVQGQDDTDVPAVQTERMVGAMRGRGNEVWYVLAKNEGSAWRSKQNRDLYLQTAASFVSELLRPSSRP